MGKVGVFDSGMGGLTVLADLLELLPTRDYVYYGDAANAPYGEKTREQVQQFSMEITEKLIDKGCTSLVIACNTATSAAGELLRSKYDFPIFGMEPALKPAVLSHQKGTILVMATSYTLTNDKYHRLRKTYQGDRKVIPVPAPKFVQLVEDGIFRGEKVQEYLRELTQDIDLKEVGSLVLGCTHFLFLKEELKQFFGDHIVIFDGNLGTARHVRNTLGPGTGTGKVEIISSGGKEMEEKSKWMLETYQKLSWIGKK